MIERLSRRLVLSMPGTVWAGSAFARQKEPFHFGALMQISNRPSQQCPVPAFAAEVGSELA